MAKDISAPVEVKTVTIHCSVASGLRLTINDQIPLNVSEGGDGYKISMTRQAIPIRYGANPGIDADLWNEWLAENANYPPVMSGHIYATED
jgi:hypothetical protein